MIPNFRFQGFFKALIPDSEIHYEVKYGSKSSKIRNKISWGSRPGVKNQQKV